MILEPPYLIAPEIMQNQTKLTQAIDIWSVGCLILQMATKQLPWMNVSKDVNEVSDMLINFKAPPKFPTNFSLEGKEFLRHCFRNEPEKRMTVKQLLLHPWLVDEIIESPLMAKTKSNRNSKENFTNEMKLKGKNLKIINPNSAANNNCNGKQNTNKLNNPIIVNILKGEDNCGEFSVTISNSESEDEENISKINICKNIDSDKSINSDDSNNRYDTKPAKKQHKNSIADSKNLKISNGNDQVVRKTTVSNKQNLREGSLKDDDCNGRKASIKNNKNSLFINNTNKNNFLKETKSFKEEEKPILKWEEETADKTQMINGKYINSNNNNNINGSLCNNINLGVNNNKDKNYFDIKDNGEGIEQINKKDSNNEYIVEDLVEEEFQKRKEEERKKQEEKYKNKQQNFTLELNKEECNKLGIKGNLFSVDIDEENYYQILKFK